VEDHDASLREYYDQNTRRFLKIGGSQGIMTIHRPVWLPGIGSRQAALQATNQMALHEARALYDAVGTLRVLDLGCGVGGTLFAILRGLPGLQCDGITLSPVQAQMAEAFARRMGLETSCRFHVSSYLQIPSLPPADMAIAIESFVLGPDPARFFASASGALRKGGRLLLIDDFLSARSAPYSQREQKWIDRFCAGWGARSLIPLETAAQLAKQAGFAIRNDTDLTSYLRLQGPRDQVVRLTLLAGRVLPLRRWLGVAYWGSLDGGDALQSALKHGIIQYHALLLEKC
jgi:SAM-dependent methyltransferase